MGNISNNYAKPNCQIRHFKNNLKTWSGLSTCFMLQHLGIGGCVDD